MEGERASRAYSCQVIVARPARAHIVLGVHFEPQSSRRIAESIGMMLWLQSQAGGWRDCHGYIIFGVREPMPFGVLIVVQVPAFTSDQALA